MTDLIFYGTLCHGPLLAAVLGRDAHLVEETLADHEVLWSAQGAWPVIRAVAGANGKNRIAVVIPCHRVVGSDGTLVGYSGGLDRKEALLSLEGAIADKLL